MSDPVVEHIYGVNMWPFSTFVPLTMSSMETERRRYPLHAAVIDTIAKASELTRKLESKKPSIIQLGVYEEKIDTLIELVRNMHMVPFVKIKNFFPTTEEVNFSSINELLRLGRKPSFEVSRSMEPHRDVEPTFTTIAVAEGVATYDLYLELGEVFKVDFKNLKKLDPILVSVEPRDLVIIGPVGLSRRSSTNAIVKANIPHGVKSGGKRSMII